ncbi:WGxxGxxG family protein [Deinococcus hopiensis]|uniref:PEP-CTERM protein-sorting domain-containing protein/MYXO-CTERM domain-containing protein n=1 Tax=Deinococcus hopiensis KR-140 TaxID=695939 RepID=A0A1W1VUK9_9DEIO|nr:WGxxGxxG family protein [Deinococcus hopiensis]SMB97055.1 PEP-CTERM protein-sorting domain-containing protein/MYXO-CTERM domain-containing protein [Deinococcus hopiensis KR-140]
MKQEAKTTLLALALGFASMPALAQDNAAETTTTNATTQNDDGGMDWSWLGLLGLAGLAGLRRKEPAVVRRDQTTTTQR